MAANKRGTKGSTGAAKGFSTPSQAGGTKTYEDVPGVDFRTFGNRRYDVGTRLPGGVIAKTSHVGQDRFHDRMAGTSLDFNTVLAENKASGGARIGTAITQRPGQPNPEVIKRAAGKRLAGKRR